MLSPGVWFDTFVPAFSHVSTVLLDPLFALILSASNVDLSRLLTLGFIHHHLVSANVVVETTQGVPFLAIAICSLIVFGNNFAVQLVGHVSLLQGFYSHILNQRSPILLGLYMFRKKTLGCRLKDAVWQSNIDFLHIDRWLMANKHIWAHLTSYFI